MSNNGESPAGTTTAEEWERKPGESAKAYSAFSIYRDAGADRSLRKVAQESSKDPAQIFRWNRQQSWQQRVSAYDAELDRRWRARLDEERLAVARRQATVFSRQIELSSRVLDAALARLHEDPEVLAGLDTGELLDRAVALGRLLPRVADAQRMALGGPPRSESEHLDDRFDRMSMEELDAFLTGVDDGRDEERQRAREESKRS